MSSHLSDAERSLIGSLAAHESWARTTNRAERTAPARAALEKKFLEEAGGDPKRAESLRRAHYTRLALKSAQSRRRRAASESPSTQPSPDSTPHDLGTAQ